MFASVFTQRNWDYGFYKILLLYILDLLYVFHNLLVLVSIYGGYIIIAFWKSQRGVLVDIFVFGTSMDSIFLMSEFPTIPENKTIYPKNDNCDAKINIYRNIKNVLYIDI